MSKPRVVVSAKWYPMCIARYFLHALKRRDDIDLVVLGPTTGTWIPWNHGMNLPEKYVITPDIPLPGVNEQTMPMQYAEFNLEEMTGDGKADLWIQIDAAFHLTGRPKSGLNFIVGTDPHVLDYSRQREYADRFFCMQKVYAHSGDIYLPYAYCPDWHAPLGVPDTFTHDAALVGLHYQERDKLVHLLRNRGMKVNYDLGPIGEEIRDIYLNAPIGLNWSSREDLVARVFELLAMGRLAIVNRVPDLERFFVPGRDLIACRSVEEAVEAVIHMRQEEPELAATMAEQGHETVKPHSYDARVAQILATAGVA